MSELARVPDAAKQRAIELEQALLGAIINRGSPAFAAAAAAGLTGGDFFHIDHAEVWGVFEAVVDIGERPNGTAAFRRLKDLAGARLCRYWTDLSSAHVAVTVRDVPYLAGDVIDERRRRAALMEAATLVTEMEAADLGPPGKRTGAPAKATIERHILRLQDVIARDTSGSSRGLADVVSDVVAQADLAGKGEAPPPGLPTGFEAIDELLSGMERGGMYVIGARPSMGKTALATGIALNVAREGKRVGFFSLEMTRSEMALRLLSLETRLPMHAIRRGRLSPDDWADRIHPAEQLIRRLKIDVDDRPGLRMAEIEATARTLGPDLGLVIIDHIGLVGAPEDARGVGLVEKTAAVSNGCKRLAKALQVPVLALCQLSRANEQRDDKRPQLSDLRWSGEIEQDADAVIFLHRQEYYVKQRDGGDDELAEVAGKAEAIIAKNRNGSTGSAQLRFESRAARFCSLTERMP